MYTNNGLALWRDAFSPIDRLLDDWMTPARTESRFVPPCDVEEQDDHYLLTLEVAGVNKDDIKMEVVDHQLLISGERRFEERKKQDGYAYSERRFGKFQRSFSLPRGLDSSKLEADYRDGVLRVMFPKAESTKPRLIKIN